MQKKTQHKENLFASIVFNVAIPIVALRQLSSVLGPMPALLLSLASPICYATFDFIKRRQINPIPIIAFVGTLIKGTFALFKLDGFWFALQEAALPTLFGAFIIISAWVNKPFIRYFIYNEDVFNISLLEKKLDEHNARKKFNAVIWQITFLFGLTFFMSGILNGILASHIIISPANTPAFNEELSRMTLLSYFIILAPKLLISFIAISWFIFRIKKLTGLSASEMINS